MLYSQDNNNILTPPLNNKSNTINNLQDVKMQHYSEEEQNNNINFMQEQGEEGENDFSNLYNEIFQNPMDVQDQGFTGVNNQVDESLLNEASLTGRQTLPQMNQDLTNLSVNNGLPFNASLLNRNSAAAAVKSNNSLINQAFLSKKAGVTLGSNGLLDPNVKSFANSAAATTSTSAAVRNNIKSSIPSPMVQTPFLHPMFSTPTFSYLSDSAVSTNGVSSPIFEFTPPSTPPHAHNHAHAHASGSSKLKNMYKPQIEDSVMENSPLLCSDYFVLPNRTNNQIVTTALKSEANLASTAFSPALNLPMKKLALFSPNVENTAVTDVYPSSYNYLDDPIVNSPLLPIQDEQGTTNSLLPLYNTGMYDVQSPFLMEKPDEGLEADSSALMYDVASTTPYSTAASTPGLLENTTLKSEVSPLLMNSPYLTEQGNLSVNQSPYLSEQAAAVLAMKRSPFLGEQSGLSLKRSPFLGEQSGLSLKRSPFLGEQSSMAINSPFVGEQSSLAVNSPFVGERPIITLNDSPCLPEQALRNKTATASPLHMDPRYASALSKGVMNSANTAFLLNKKRKLGVMNYPSYGPLSKIPRKERNALDEISAGFKKKNDNSAIKPSPLLQETTLDIEPMEAVTYSSNPVDHTTFLSANGVVGKVNSNDSINPALLSPNNSNLTNSVNSSPLFNTSPKASAVLQTTTSTIPTMMSSGIPSSLQSNALKPVKMEKEATNSSILPVIPSSGTLSIPSNSIPSNGTPSIPSNPVPSSLKPVKMEKGANKTPIIPDSQPTSQFMKDYSNLLMNDPSALLTKIHIPTLVSMAGIKLDTKSAKSTDNEKNSKSKSTKGTKKGKRGKKAATSTETKPTENPGGEFMKMKLEKPETADANANTNDGFLVPSNVPVHPGEEMDYHDIPTINLGSTPNLDMLSPASSSIGMSTPNLGSPLLKPISFNLNSNIQLVKKRAKKKYPCTYPGCTKSFSRPCHRQSHERSHENSRPFVCPECKRAFCRKHDMIRHQRIHSKERPYQCKICKRKFARGDALVRHRTRPTSSCYQADMAYAKKLRQQQHKLLQQQQQLEYERLQKEKQMEEAAAAAIAAASGATSSTTSDVIMKDSKAEGSSLPIITVTSANNAAGASSNSVNAP